MAFNLLGAIRAIIWLFISFIIVRIFFFSGLWDLVADLISGWTVAYYIVQGLKWLMSIFFLFYVPIMAYQGKIDATKIVSKLTGGKA